MRLVDAENGTWVSRRLFFFSAARAMRDILVERRRRKEALKRGGAWVRDDLEIDELPTLDAAETLVMFADALERLEREGSDDRRLVRMRFFEGLTNEETALALGVSVSSVEREWRALRARLGREIG